MSLSFEFESFYNNWLNKAKEYSESSKRACFDKFFTLFVVYNRLYAETTFILARKKEINISNRNSFPDAKAAKDYVLQYLKSSYLLECLECNSETNLAIQKIKRLIKDQSFNIKLHMVSGGPQRDKDLKLLEDLNSNNNSQKAKAILDIVYSIRCNTLHGHKSFNGVQVDILKPVISILNEIITILHKKLSD